MTATIRDLRGEDEDDWRRLWSDYLLFSGKNLPKEVTDHTWGRLIDPLNNYQCLVAEISEAINGFAITQMFQSSWHIGDIYFLEDLFVSSKARGRGIGQQLINACVASAKEQDFACVFWQTEEDNLNARKLYDQLTGGATSLVTYELAL